MISGSIKGADKVLKSLNKAAKVFEQNRNYAVKESTLALHAEAVRIVSENEGGTSQIRYSPRRTVSVSKPNTPPHTDTGQLRKSIKFNYKEDTGQVGSNLKYAAWLEFGTVDMAPRPWLSTAVENVSERVAEIFDRWMKKSIDEAL
jgi:HK97 gp10 family phage protein